MIKWFKKKETVPVTVIDPTPINGSLRIRQSDENVFYLEQYWKNQKTWSWYWDAQYCNYYNYGSWVQSTGGLDQPSAIEAFSSFAKAHAFYEKVLKNRERLALEREEAYKKITFRRDNFENVFYPPDFKKEKHV